MTASMKEIDTKVYKTFTTEPKTRRHISPYSISGNRLRDFMESCYRKNLHKCRYAVLVYEFVNHFETNDPRIYERYLGRPESVKRYPGSAVVRMNRMAGKIAKFDYMNERHIEAKQGLAQVLGWITFEKENCILHHEKLSYSKKQANLETASQSLENERIENVSKDNLCVSSLCDESVLQGKECEKTVLEVVSPTNNGETKETREEEESYRQHTHKSVLPEGITEKHTVLQSQPKENES